MAAKRKLSNSDIKLIRAAHIERKRLMKEANELTAIKLGEKFGVSEASIRDIYEHRTYRNVL